MANPREEIKIDDISDKKQSEKVLDILDTYHDFCKGERKKKSAAGKEDETADKRVMIMRKYLPLLLAKKFTNFDRDGADYTQNIKTISKDKITSVSKIEHQTIDLFEEKYKDQIDAFPETKEVVTMKDIVNAYDSQRPFDENTNPLWKQFKTNEANRVLEIQKDGFELKTESAEKVANFILNYFFYTSSQKDVHITFDAAEGTVGEIFRDIESVKNIIFPQTIADSATTSLNVMKGRCDYIFPSKSNMIEFASNLFSHSDYRIYFKKNEKAPFGNTNPYGFSIIIAKKSDEEIFIEVPFSSTQTEGPSVNYIIDILNTLQLSKDKKVQLSKIQKKSSIVNLGLAFDKSPRMKQDVQKETRDQKNGILPDLKRGGDHEAVNAAKYVIQNEFPFTLFTTIDMLCALKARKEEINTIWQTSERLVLYRFPTAKPEEQEKYNLIIKAQDSADLIERIQLIVAKGVKKGTKTKPEPSLLEEDFAKQIAEAEKAMAGVSDIQGTNEKCIEALNALLRIRMLDMKRYLEANKTINIEAKDTAYIQTASAKVSLLKDKVKDDLLKEGVITKVAGIWTYEEGKGAAAKSINLTEATEYQAKLSVLYKSIIADLKTKIHIDINAAETDLANKLKVYKPLTKDETTYSVFLPTDHSVFQYSSGPFVRFYEMMLLVDELRVSGAAKRDYPIKMKKFLQKEKGGSYSYFEIVEEIIDQFQTEDIKEDLVGILNITNKALEAAKAASATSGSVDRDTYLRYFLTGETAGIKGVIDEILDYYTRLSTSTGKGKAKKRAQIPYAMTTMKGGSSPLQNGGATGEYYELSDLLFSISTKAAAYIESAFSNQYFYYALKSKIKYLNTVWAYIRKEGQQSLYNMPYCIRLFNDILDLHTVLVSDKSYTAFTKDLSDEEKLEINKKWSLVNGYRNTFKDYDLSKNKQNYRVEINASIPIIAPLKQMDTLIGYLNDWLKELVETYRVETTILYPNLQTLFASLNTADFQVPTDDSEYIYTESNEEEAPIDLDDESTAVATVNGIQKLMEDIQEEWEYGLATLRETKDYTFRTGGKLRTEDILSAIFALQSDKTLLYVLDTNAIKEELLNRTAFTEFKGLIQADTKDDKLCFLKAILLTLLENIQNPRKYSFFLSEKYTNRYFDSESDWNTYLGASVLPALVGLLQRHRTEATQFTMPRETILGGGSRSYPKKTRKHAAKKRSRTSRKYNKTRRVR